MSIKKQLFCEYKCTFIINKKGPENRNFLDTERESKLILSFLLYSISRIIFAQKKNGRKDDRNRSFSEPINNILFFEY